MKNGQKIYILTIVSQMNKKTFRTTRCGMYVFTKYYFLKKFTISVNASSSLSLKLDTAADVAAALG